jgi:murein DD-endopeptidase MepM/ murein hydrolase activator NlpD
MNTKIKLSFLYICLLLNFSSCSSIGVESVGGLSSFGGFGSQSGVPAKPIYHVISKGESLLGISGKYQATPDEILMLNGLQTTKYFRVGQKLLVGYRYPEDEINDTDTRVVRASMRTTPENIPNSDSSVSPRIGSGEVSFQGGRVSWPLKGKARIVSQFGPRWGTFHDGLDLAAPTGTNVLAAHSGTIAYAGSDLGGYGKLLVIKGDDGLISVYAHNSRLYKSQGDKVAVRDHIADVGATGKAEGPHLHFEIRTRDKRGKAVAVDPLPLLKANEKDRPRYRINDSLQPLLAWLE